MDTPDTGDKEGDGVFGPWNPGIRSQMPRRVLRLSTMFATENVATGFDEAHELSTFCGLSPVDLVAFRAQRLIVHELLVRVTADLSVPDGPNYEDLGINLRAMVRRIHDGYVMPHFAALESQHHEIRQRAGDKIGRLLAMRDDRQPAKVGAVKPSGSWLHRLFGDSARDHRASRSEQSGERGANAVAAWKKQRAGSVDPLELACLDALVKIVDAVTRHRGRLMGDNAMISDLAVNQVANHYGSRQLGEAIRPYIRQAAEAESYRYLPPQREPVVMNVKGASAAGKSTIRPQQRRLAEKLGVPWHDFALISPDYWRKFLLDYDSLGDDYKYAAMLTGHELEIIDKKLDRYMAEKAARGAMSHLLIDRFRFDSFIAEANRDIDSTLLTRFGELIFLYFMITPPEATVERAWLRGLETGRYKAVDDLIDHNIEAYKGMPALFFSWVSVTNKRIHYEFLDNGVPKGQLPRTVAFGWNETMTILDVKSMLDIDRFKEIDVDARRPEDLYLQQSPQPEKNVVFLRQCAHSIPTVNFADYRTGLLYGRLAHGDWTWQDEAAAAAVLSDKSSRLALEAIGWGQGVDPSRAVDKPNGLAAERDFILGEWNPEF